MMSQERIWPVLRLQDRSTSVSKTDGFLPVAPTSRVSLTAAAASTNSASSLTSLRGLPQLTCGEKKKDLITLPSGNSLPSLCKCESVNLSTELRMDDKEKKVLMCAEQSECRPFTRRKSFLQLGIRKPLLAEDPKIFMALKSAANKRNPDRKVTEEGFLAITLFSLVQYTLLYYSSCIFCLPFTRINFYTEVMEQCNALGIDPETEQDLVYIAREALKAPLPDAWKPVYALTA